MRIVDKFLFKLKARKWRKIPLPTLKELTPAGRHLPKRSLAVVGTMRVVY